MSAYTLASGDGRSGDRMTIAGYLGTSEIYDRAMADFAFAYADQNQRDYETVAAVLRAGKLDPAQDSPVNGHH
jgi:hypothetical protein